MHVKLLSAILLLSQVAMGQVSLDLTENIVPHKQVSIGKGNAIINVDGDAKFNTMYVGKELELKSPSFNSATIGMTWPHISLSDPIGTNQYNVISFVTDGTITNTLSLSGTSDSEQRITVNGGTDGGSLKGGMLRVGNAGGEDGISDFWQIEADNTLKIGDNITANLFSIDASGNVFPGGTVDGRDIATDGVELDGMESGATADQSDAEIKTAYENNADTNAFTDTNATTLSSALQDVVGDLSPQLGGDLDVNGKSITGDATFVGEVSVISGALGTGVDDSVRGIVSIHGDATTGGGQIRFRNSGSEDTTNQYWRAEANGDEFRLGANTDGVSNFIFGSLGDFTTAGEVVVESALPYLGIDETDANTDEGKWRLSSTGGRLDLWTVTDAGTNVRSIIQANRTGSSTNTLILNSDDGTLTLKSESGTDEIVSILNSGAGRMNTVMQGFLTVQDYFGADPQYATGDGTTTIDWGESNFENYTFGAFSETFTFTDPPSSGEVIIKLVQDGVGARTATWPASAKWAGGVAPTLTTAASAVDVFKFYFDGADYNELSRSLDVK